MLPTPVRRLLIAITAVLAALAFTLTPARADSGFPSVGQDWGGPGPYQVSEQVGLVTTFYYPSDIGSSSLKYPVIIWGNGTFAIPLFYHDLLTHWASHGFIVAASNSTQSDTGISMRYGIDELTRMNDDAGSPFYQHVDLAHIGASGHSQGGAGAINAGWDSRVSTIAAIQPGPLASTSGLHGPALFLAGQNDLVVWPSLVRAFYNSASQVPAVYAELAGAGHLTTVGDGGGFRAITTAWFRYQLMGDPLAGDEFFGPNCGYCSDPVLSGFQRNALALQVPTP